MPVVLRHKGFRFFFYSNEGHPLEPIHIHVRHGAAEAKFWLNPAVRVAGSYGMNAPTLRELAAVIEQNRRLIEEAWHERFGKDPAF